MWNLPRPEIKPVSQTCVPPLHWQADSQTLDCQGSPTQSFLILKHAVLTPLLHRSFPKLSIPPWPSCLWTPIIPVPYIWHTITYFSLTSLHSASWQSFWNVMETYTPIQLIFSVSKGTPQVLQMSAWNTAPLYSETIDSNFVSVIPNNIFATVLDRPFSVFI